MSDALPLADTPEDDIPLSQRDDTWLAAHIRQCLDDHETSTSAWNQEAREAYGFVSGTSQWSEEDHAFLREHNRPAITFNRTGRAGKSGKAFTFVSGRELYKLQSMVHFAKLKIRRENIPSLDQVEEARENVFFEKLRATLDAGEFRKQERMIDRLLEQGYASTDIASALIHILQGQGTTAAAKTDGYMADTPAPKPSVKASAPARAERPAPAYEADDSGEAPETQAAPATGARARSKQKY